jgi:uncharacterized membrane protein
MAKSGATYGEFFFAVGFLLAVIAFAALGYWYYRRTQAQMREQVLAILAEYMPLEDTEDQDVGL